jgi:hypothetical protein
MTYSLEEIKDNLFKLENKLKEKGLHNGFWVIASRKDFKPLEIEVSENDKTYKKKLVKVGDLRKYLLKDNYKYYIGKKVSAIQILLDKLILNDTKTYKESNYEEIKDDFICRINVSVSIVDEHGKIYSETKEWNSWECKVNFTVEDLRKIKLKLSDIEPLMRQVADGLVRTNNFIGISYQGYIKAVKKNKKLLKKNK